MYGLIDCNNFFVSCERVFNPQLNGKPVVVLSNNDGCVIARSNEAKVLGIPMGCPAFQIANHTNPANVIQLSARHIVYRDLSHRVMSILAREVENLQIYSVDEAFFTLPYEDVERNHQLLARLVTTIRQHVGIPVSAGFAPSHTLAKVAAHVAKKDPRITDGVYWLVRPQAIEIILKRIPVGDIWGIGRRLEASLQQQGVFTAAQFVQLPSSQVRARYSVMVERTQRELMGIDCQVVNPVTIAHKSVMNSRTFGQLITAREDLQDAITHFAQRTARQLRHEASVAGSIMVYVRGDRFRQDVPFYANSCQLRLPTPANDDVTLVHHALMALRHIYRNNRTYRKAGVMALDISNCHNIQLNVFDTTDHSKLRRLMASIDNINDHYGSQSVKLAPTLLRGNWAPHQTHLQQGSHTLHFYTGMANSNS